MPGERRESLRLLLDGGVEDRGVVLAEGRPRKLILDRPERPGEAPSAWLRGESLVARVARLDRGLGLAFLDAGDAPGLVTPAGALREGQLIAGCVAAPARRGKLAVMALLAGEGRPEAGVGARARPSVADRLQAAAPGVAIEEGAVAREACDAAEDEALQTEHAIAGGARLFVEPTRALVAVDVDVGSSAAGGDAKRRQRQANLAALHDLPRLLRLKGLGGVVAIDLVGKGHDGVRLAEAAKAAFTPVFGVETAIGPISRFGLMQVQVPWRDAPVADLLRDPEGRVSALTGAFALLRAIEREAGPGGRVLARCAPAVFEAAAAYVPRLKGVIGDRFTLSPDPALGVDRPIVQPQ